MSRTADDRMGWEKTQQKIGILKRKQRSNIILATASAAAILLLMIFLYQTEKFQRPIEVALVSAEPGKSRATLIMSDGSKFNLTDSTNSTIKDASGAEIIIDKGERIDYKNLLSSNDKPIINTLIIPRSGTFKVVLSDGTQVYINSESQLSYPIVFNGAKREVSLKGEAFFKVAEDKQHPFVVNCNGNYVTVTGTEFNVNSYDSDNTITTLVSGGVLLSNSSGSATLSPGLQGIMNSSGISLFKVDPALYSSWINGIFVFDNMELGEMAKILSRWYNVDFEFSDSNLCNLTFTASFPRDENLSFIVKLIERISSARFEQSENTITVKNVK